MAYKTRVSSETPVKTKIVVSALIFCGVLLLPFFIYNLAAGLSKISSDARIVEPGSKNTSLPLTAAQIANLKKNRIKQVDQLFKNKKAEETVKIDVVFNMEGDSVKKSSVNKSSYELPDEVSDIYINENEKIDLKLNGKSVSQSEFANYEKERSQKVLTKNKRALDYSKEKIKDILNPDLNDKNKLTLYPAIKDRSDLLKVLSGRRENQEAISQALKSGSDVITLELTVKEYEKLKKIAEKDDAILAIEPFLETEDQLVLSNSMKLTDTNPYSSLYSTKGHNIGIMMAEVDCCPLAKENGTARYRYTILPDGQGSISGTKGHACKVFDVLKSAANNARVYCVNAYKVNRNVSFDTQGEASPIYLINASFAAINDSNYEPIGVKYYWKDRDFDELAYESDMAIFVGSGNIFILGETVLGSTSVTTPSKAPNVITVGSYETFDDSLIKEKYISDFSRYSDPVLGNEKPEIVAPGANITGWTDDYDNKEQGTSFSTPHAAGMAASLMSSDKWGPYLKYRPARLKAVMMAGATDEVAGGVEKVGVGGANWYNSYKNQYNSSWYGSWLTDYFPNDLSYIEKSITIPAGKKVRAVLTWLNDGDYIYDIGQYQTSGYRLGVDFDMYLYDSTGKTNLGYSNSLDNPYEILEFTNSSNTTQIYKIKIYRISLSDTDMKLRMSLSVRYYDHE